MTVTYTSQNIETKTIIVEIIVCLYICLLLAQKLPIQQILTKFCVANTFYLDQYLLYILCTIGKSFICTGMKGKHSNRLGLV